MKNVYCRYCKYFSWWRPEHTCRILETKNTWHTENFKSYQNAEFKNGNNDCKDFKKKRNV